jgi:hypothetical protein
MQYIAYNRLHVEMSIDLLGFKVDMFIKDNVIYLSWTTLVSLCRYMSNVYLMYSLSGVNR